MYNVYICMYNVYIHMCESLVLLWFRPKDHHRHIIHTHTPTSLTLTHITQPPTTKMQSTQDRTPLLEAVAVCDTLGERAERIVALLHQSAGADLQAVDACTYLFLACDCMCRI